ncbi:ArgE/DapE family deacylase [Macrococcus bovicus]|uniref:Probable succinyl-diaminopimelate desuccinylase n=1 Tax=Macrococcus bovicus TaxID=69968 RepID=A0A4R6C163_9STAP|nr:ArgE/DapE family deacylase [Macrococcus bovicus]TDM14927.1 ArgE/DapE family deacylase [Macrococcus bovicus]
MAVMSQEEKVRLLSDVVAIKSVNDNERSVCEYLQKLLSRYNIASTIENINEDRANLIAEIGEGKPVLAFSGHMDVVSAGNSDNWKYDPFEMTEENGKLYGRGTADMKSGLVALVIAMIEIQNENLLKKGTIRLLATAGEEMEQKGSEQLYRNGYMEDVDALIIAEPSESMIAYAHKGSMNFRVTSKGKASHSSAPFMGQNAIKPLIGFIGEVENEFNHILRDTEFKELDFSPLSENAKKELDIEISSESLGSAILTNTIIQGGNQVNSIPEYAVAEFNARTVPEFDNEQMLDLFKKTMKNQKGTHELSLELNLNLPPVVTEKENRLVTLSKKYGEHYLEHAILVAPTMGVTDASNLLKEKDEDFPLVVFGPGDPSMAHQTDEYVEKEKYIRFIEIYKEIAVRYLSGMDH